MKDAGPRVWAGQAHSLVLPSSDTVAALAPKQGLVDEKTAHSADSCDTAPFHQPRHVLAERYRMQVREGVECGLRGFGPAQR
eukprot:scaffold1201_cov413-Prasinococcus_capsulatus_cf.AAC.4